jgi:hypothetical protein
MNQYGARAQKHWQKWLPNRYCQLEDPDSFFTSLGEELSVMIHDLKWALAGDDPAEEEGYLEKVGRLNMALLNAESQVMREYALLDPEQDSQPAKPPL